MKKNINNKALFLDRDGVLNHLINKRPPWLLKEIKIYQEAFKLVKLAKRRFYLPIVISNQPDAGRGTISYEKLHLVNKKIMNELQIEQFFLCTHPYDGECDCRKPLPGNFFKAQKINNLDLKKSIMVGDRDKDIIAGNRAGCKTIKISEKNSELADFNVDNHQNLLKLLDKLLI